jgi:outer membrane protein assembly factor BamA
MDVPKYRISFLITSILLMACSVTKHLPESEKLYTGAVIKINSKDITAKERKVLKEGLEGLTRPKPNSKILGIPFKLSVYNMFRNKKEKSFFGKLRTKYGEPPVLLSSLDLQQNVKVLQNHSENKGFFNTKVTGDTVVKARRAHALYKVETGHQYTINTIQIEQDSIALTKTLQQSMEKSLLKKGNPFDLDVIKAERNRIDAFLKENGYYYFSPEFLLLKVDSTNGKNQVDMRVAVKPETPAQAKNVYRINNVYIYTGYNLTSANVDTNKAHARFYEGYYILDRRKRYKPFLFSQVMKFESGDVYSRKDHNITLNRLINLNLFKFVKNRFEQVPDSAKLDAYYYLTPLPKKSLRAEVTTTTKSNNLNGTEISFHWLNRNTFRAGEQLKLSAYIGSEIQFGGTFKGYNTYRSGAQADLTVPRFLIPWLDLNTRGGYVPRTNLQLGYDIMTRKKLYTINSFRGSYGYLWKESIEKQHELYPISINYVQSLNVTKEFKDSISKYPFLQRIVDKQFILGSTYQYNLNQLANGLQKVNSFYFNGLVDLSGNIAGLVTGANIKEGKQTSLFNTPFDQYIKLEADGRYYRRVGLHSSWANRLIIGYGHPYGNSLVIPYIKQFFVGGNNSIRAFRSRSVGPGTYHQVSKNFLADQTGDLKLEINTEFRPQLFGPLYGAIFLDAGNIWLANEDATRPGSKFSKEFLNQLAVGTGLGIRLDITLFVIRLDAGIPLRKPWEQNPWVINQIRLNSSTYRKENIIYNLAIGYPF